MKEIFIFTTVVIFIALLAYLLLNKPNKAPVLPIAMIIYKLQEHGYGLIRKIELDRDVYLAEIINSQGMELRLRLHAHTGDLIKHHRDQTNLSMLDAIQVLERSGYQTIYKISAEVRRYKAQVLNEIGKRVDLKIDARTGIIRKGWF